MLLESLKNLLKTESSAKEPLLKNDDVFIVAYPKSGSTWVRFVISNYLLYPETCNFNNYHLIVPDIHYNPEQIRKVKSVPVFVKSHSPYTPQYKKVVYIIRDPRDVAVSYFYHCKKFRKIAMDTTFDDFIKILLNLKPSAQSDAINKFGSWNNHVLSWVNHKKENIIILKYEDILADAKTNFIKVFTFAGKAIDNNQLEKAIESSSFSKLKKLEEENQKSENITGNMKASDKSIPFVREGKAGGYKGYFTLELEQLFMKENYIATTMFGYSI